MFICPLSRLDQHISWPDCLRAHIGWLHCTQMGLSYSVALNRVRLCPTEIRSAVVNISESGLEEMQSDTSVDGGEDVYADGDDHSEEPDDTAEETEHSVQRGRLRPRTGTS